MLIVPLINLVAEDRSVGEELGDDEAEESHHRNAAVPSLRLGCEWAEATSICGLSAHDGHEGGVGEDLHRS